MDWFSQTDSNGIVTYHYNKDLTSDNAGDILIDGQAYVGINTTVNIGGNDIYLMDNADWDYVVGQVPSLPNIDGVGLSGAGYAWAYALNANGNAEALAASRTTVLLRDRIAYEQKMREAALEIGMLGLGGGAVTKLLSKFGLHDAHHTFGRFGKLKHFQLNIWKKGVKESSKAFRLPIPGTGK